MISKAIILANSIELTGPQTVLGDSSLIKRALLSLEMQGIHEVVVVTSEDIEDDVMGDPDIVGRIRWVKVDKNCCASTGLTIARKMVDGPVLVLHSSILFSPNMLGPLVDLDQNSAEPTLLIDRKIHRLFDPKAVLRVQTENDRIKAIGFDLDEYDAVAVGMAVFTPEVFEAIEKEKMQSLELVELLQRMMNRCDVLAWDINGAMWQQVHSVETKNHAEWMLRAYGEELHDDIAPPSTNERRPMHDHSRTLNYIEGLLSDSRSRARHYVLMNPGPVLTSPRVKSALVHHDVCHRDEDYAVVARRIRRKLRQICKGGAEHDVMLISGSGTAAMEATISSCVPEDGKLLVISNGAFGERFAEIAKVHKFDTVHLKYNWGELVDPADVKARLMQDPSIVAVVMCHHETSIGILNPVNKIGTICRELDRLFFVDSVSSLGAEDIDVRRDKIDVLISSANKCLHAISGVSFTCVNRRIWSRIESIEPRSYYLDLRRYYTQQIPFTPAVSSFFALDAALDELLREGLSQRHQRYRRLNAQLRRELRRIGLERFSLTGHESHTITTFKTPEYIQFKDLYQQLKDRGYIIYGCKAHLQDRYFQIANMGNLSDDHIRGFVDTLTQVLAHAAARAGQQPRIQVA